MIQFRIIQIMICFDRRRQYEEKINRSITNT